MARLSKDAWVEWAKSSESDEIYYYLDPIINEIEDRMHEKLEVFQASFFGSLGAASKKIDEATGQSTIKAITREKPHHGGLLRIFLMKRQGLDGLLKGPNSPEQGSNKPQTRPKLGLE